MLMALRGRDRGRVDVCLGRRRELGHRHGPGDGQREAARQSRLGRRGLVGRIGARRSRRREIAGVDFPREDVLNCAVRAGTRGRRVGGGIGRVGRRCRDVDRAPRGGGTTVHEGLARAVVERHGRRRAAQRRPTPSTSVVTVVVLVDVMLRVPAAAAGADRRAAADLGDRRGVDDRFGDRRVDRVQGASARRCADGGVEVDRGGRVCRDRDVAAGPVDRDLRRRPCDRDRRARFEVGDGRGHPQRVQTPPRERRTCRLDNALASSVMLSAVDRGPGHRDRGPCAAAVGSTPAAAVVSEASTSTLPDVASIVTSVKVTEVTPETFKASVPDAVSRVIVPPLPPNVTLWLGSSWLDVLAPCTRSEVTPENACAEKSVPLTEMADPEGVIKAWSLAAERLTSSTPDARMQSRSEVCAVQVPGLPENATSAAGALREGWRESLRDSATWTREANSTCEPWVQLLGVDAAQTDRTLLAGGGKNATARVKGFGVIVRFTAAAALRKSSRWPGTRRGV